MPEGTVSRIVRGEFGFIKPDVGDDDIYFRCQWVKDVPASGIRIGLRVEYEVRKTERGFQTQWVRAIGEQLGIEEQKKLDQRSLGGYHFLNPYNFIRPLPVLKQGEPLLRRCPPPPHDRYSGLSGRITCELTVVTPLFTGDAEGADKVGADHYGFRFFQYDGKAAIPATSLRGPIRSIFEAATNSCYSVFAGYRRLSQHFDSRRAPWLVPARVEQEDNGWKLRLLTGTTPLQVGRAPGGKQYAAWVYRYWPMRPSGTLHRQPPANARVRDFQNRRHKGQPASLNSLKHGDECFALLEEVQHPFPQIKFWDLIALNRDPSVLQRKKKPGQHVERGWLCLTNQNIEPKHSERFFFRAGDNNTGPEWIDLPKAVRTEYEDLITDYQERHAEEVRKRRDSKQSLDGPISKKEAGLSRFIYDKNDLKLKDGALVYAYLSGSADQPQVDFIVPVSVPRVGYHNSIGDLLPKDLHKCERIEELCPACRLFGWVWGTGDPREVTPALESVTAYAGRVRFSHALLVKDAGTFDTTLAILSNPKPTTVRFYLMNKDGKFQDGRDDDLVNYDAKDQVLRGRKIYRHHGDRFSEQEYQRADDIADDQNRTVKGVQKAGSQFSFEVRFENLAPVELGALLWAIEMAGWHHRFGLGKPLGFGSAQVSVNSIEVLDLDARYRECKDGWVDRLSQKDDWVNLFKSAMTDLYGTPFEELVNIRDMRALLAESPTLPVHYPRTSEEPAPEGKNFEWFMGNNRAGREAGPRLTLRTADEDTEGLPILDKYGKSPKS